MFGGEGPGVGVLQVSGFRIFFHKTGGQSVCRKLLAGLVCLQKCCCKTITSLHLLHLLKVQFIFSQS
ncbi:hypothetical protein EK904_012467 [Melospiza melodia maxima]|nr:hypothetical protein EK904_012467 [Melospiza melodia maxima]